MLFKPSVNQIGINVVSLDAGAKISNLLADQYDCNSGTDEMG